MLKDQATWQDQWRKLTLIRRARSALSVWLGYFFSTCTCLVLNWSHEHWLHASMNTSTPLSQIVTSPYWHIVIATIYLSIMSFVAVIPRPSRLKGINTSIIFLSIGLAVVQGVGIILGGEV